MNHFDHSDQRACQSAWLAAHFQKVRPFEHLATQYCLWITLVLIYPDSILFDFDISIHQYKEYGGIIY